MFTTSTHKQIKGLTQRLHYPLSIRVIPKTSAIGGRRGVDGLLGLDAIADYDVDLNIPQRRLGLYEARHCPAGAPPFGGPTETFKLPPSPYRFAYLPMTVDHRSLNVIADTGASTTYLNQSQLNL